MPLLKNRTICFSYEFQFGKIHHKGTEITEKREKRESVRHHSVSSVSLWCDLSLSYQGCHHHRKIFPHRLLLKHGAAAHHDIGPHGGNLGDVLFCHPAVDAEKNLAARLCSKLTHLGSPAP